MSEKGSSGRDNFKTEKHYIVIIIYHQNIEQIKAHSMWELTSNTPTCYGC